MTTAAGHPRKLRTRRVLGGVLGRRSVGVRGRVPGRRPGTVRRGVPVRRRGTVRRGVPGRRPGTVRVRPGRRVSVARHGRAPGRDLPAAAGRLHQVAERHRLLPRVAVRRSMTVRGTQPLRRRAGDARADRGVVAGPVPGGRPDRSVGELLQGAGQRAGIGGGRDATEADGRGGGGCGSFGAKPGSEPGGPPAG